MSSRRHGKKNSDNENQTTENAQTQENRNKRPQRVSETTARGVIGLMALIFIFQAVTFILHKCQGDRAVEPVVRQDSTALPKPQAILFEFNPNTISVDSLQLLGLSYKQALAIIHYRDKGGRFRRKEDFAKMYTVSPRKYEELAPYITIPEPQENRLQTQKAKPRENQQAPQSSEHQITEKAPSINSNGSLHNYNSKVYIDLNEADSASLRSVRGIGEYFCKSILRYRSALGSFANIEQLLEIKGMDQEKLDRIKDQVFVHPGGIKKFSIAEMDQKFLSRHPYIGAYNARGIALFLESHSKEECTLKALQENNILSPEDTLRLHPYMKQP